MKKTESFQRNLLEDLENPAEAVAYLNAAIEAGDREAFLLALRNVIDAQVSLAEMARRTKIHRVSLHKMFAPEGNPTTESLIAMFRVLGLRLQLGRRSKNMRKAA